MPTLPSGATLPRSPLRYHLTTVRARKTGSHPQKVCNGNKKKGAVVGCQCGDISARLDALLFEFQPSTVVVTCGSNDLLHLNPPSPSTATTSASTAPPPSDAAVAAAAAASDKAVAMTFSRYKV